MLGQRFSNRKSKQLYHLNLEGGHCELSSPDVALAPIIDYYWLLCIDDSSLNLEIIPDTAVDLVLSPDIADFAALYLPVEDKFRIALDGPIQYAGICFRSDTVWKLLGHDMPTLKQLDIGLETVDTLRINSLLQEIQGNVSLEYLTTLFDEFWLSRLKESSPSQPNQTRVSHAALITVLEDSLGTDTIASVCTALGVSERQLRRLSRDLFGLSPKKLQKVLRLQAALDELFHCEESQIRDLYYDDSHRIKELKRLTGCTPNKIRQMAEKYNNR